MVKTRSRSIRTGGGSSGAAWNRVVHNEILLCLPRSEHDLVFSALEFAELPTRERLNETGQPIEHGYFVEGGLASVLSVMADGKSVEVGLTGKEGFVGLPLVVGLDTSAHRVVMQVAGAAFRIPRENLTRLLLKCPQLEKRLNRYAQVFALQSGQSAACNNLHDVEQRLARWLLMSQDRLGGELVPLTQEFLAHMLGTRRASVTVAAGFLQDAGLIRYSRGIITIVNRGRLESAACECYAIMMRQLQNWRNETP
jgi:CRP-like cAMP-binding protein